ncbi:L-glyceraldehyde 3-phosphate reductase [Halanaerobacter jeridensis]|uniref:L-glyceraldehyde 3-phosphate reductase n=1 Tax=Halanaerobacter jeridensis TaxID=706427 RepID=A0A938XQT7_9FIRM|nr:L-glyceraldehyde 3-phosphate reductase [Halanaerobacter jeridensis]MBM7555685.1 L-glyceraldehyde 3-phosphate reductase [Halanaerobacter jeridensis]
MVYSANDNRYEDMTYNYCGNSGLQLPAISLGMWHNFGGVDKFETSRAMVRRAFDLGITHFDLANNYGPPAGSAEETLGRILKKDLAPYRDQLIISTKAGYGMWSGPYGDGGSKKYLTASLDQSLERLGLDYVDIFYHHRPDPNTPLEETMKALDRIVKQGKALYVGISNYNAQQTKRASEILRDLGTPFIINQVSYSMFDRWTEESLIDTLGAEGLGGIIFSPLAQGLLTDKYIDEIPEDSRAASSSQFLNETDITDEKLTKIKELHQLAQSRGQSLAQMALAWVLRHDSIASVLVGASKVSQIEENIQTVDRLDFTTDELNKIDEILS